ncbi:MAG: hypothetical protein JNL60_19585 [Bacteroidia bacterium]|nr:hypothetical protein [Bacteroidia bacterium]
MIQTLTKILLFFLLILNFGWVAGQHDSSMFNFSPLQSNGMGKPVVRIVVNKSFKQTAGWTEKLKDIGKVNIVYSYNSMGVCEYTSEKSFLEHKQKTYSAKKYAKFSNEWYAMREQSMEPKFLEYFNKNIMEVGMMGFNDARPADATLRVEILYMDPEDHRYVNSPPPYISTICTFFAKDEILARYEFVAVGSREKNMRDRMTECFAIAGKMLSKNIVKKMRAIEKNGPVNSGTFTESED